MSEHKDVLVLAATRTEVEAQLAEEGQVPDRFGLEVAVGHQHADSHGQIESAPRLAGA